MRINDGVVGNIELEVLGVSAPTHMGVSSEALASKTHSFTN